MLPFIAKSHTFTHACVCIWVNIDPIIVSLQFQQIYMATRPPSSWRSSATAPDRTRSDHATTYHTGHDTLTLQHICYHLQQNHIHLHGSLNFPIYAVIGYIFYFIACVPTPSASRHILTAKRKSCQRNYLPRMRQKVAECKQDGWRAI